jgi:hypothetical protein
LLGIKLQEIFEGKGDEVRRADLALTVVDGPAGFGVGIDRSGSGEFDLLDISLGCSEGQRLRLVFGVECNLDIGQHEVSVSRSTGAFFTRGRCVDPERLINACWDLDIKDISVCGPNLARGHDQAIVAES